MEPQRTQKMDSSKFGYARQNLAFSQGLLDQHRMAKMNPLGQGSLNMAKPEMPLPTRMAQETIKAPLRAAGAMVDVGRQMAGGQPLPRTELPGLGEFATPARQYLEKEQEYQGQDFGKTRAGLEAVSGGMLDAAAAGGMAKLATGVTKADALTASIPAVDTAMGSFDEEMDDETVSEIGAALGAGKLSQEELIKSRDALHEKVKNTTDINARKKFIKAFKLISKLIK